MMLLWETRPERAGKKWLEGKVRIKMKRGGQTMKERKDYKRY